MKRHRLASGILGIVGAFVLLVACTLIAKSRTAPIEPVGPAASSADLGFKEAKIECLVYSFNAASGFWTCNSYEDLKLQD